MRRPVGIAFALTFALLLVPAVAVADSAAHTYQLVMEEPNLGAAANGDQIAVTGEGEFSVHPKAVEAEGEFTHTDSSGAVLATGTWTATGLLSYHSYGCGEVFGTPIPPEFCGGAVKMRVTLTPDGTSMQVPGILTVYCVIGPHPPHSILGPLGEGVTLKVPGIQNFNHSSGGDNVYIQIS
jgi:hypothetical protein